MRSLHLNTIISYLRFSSWIHPFFWIVSSYLRGDDASYFHENGTGDTGLSSVIAALSYFLSSKCNDIKQLFLSSIPNKGLLLVKIYAIDAKK
ncbi:MAG: hypothetical protein HWQ43_11760 [Nostoc sp. JL31]|nr:hypothetical protein [Nostoc sp. JL31]